jgi:hypothetical protein
MHRLQLFEPIKTPITIKQCNSYASTTEGSLSATMAAMYKYENHYCNGVFTILPIVTPDVAPNWEIITWKLEPGLLSTILHLSKSKMGTFAVYQN